MRRATRLLAAALLTAAPHLIARAEGSGARREKVLAIAEAEARRADESARARVRDKQPDPLEQELVEHLARSLGVELLVPPASSDAALEQVRRFEALRVAVYARLSRLRSGGYEALAEALSARRAFEHRVIRMELPRVPEGEALLALVRALEGEPTLRAVLFLHARAGQSAEALRERVEEEFPELKARRLIASGSSLPRDGATLFLVRVRVGEE